MNTNVLNRLIYISMDGYYRVVATYMGGVTIRNTAGAEYNISTADFEMYLAQTECMHDVD